MKLTPNGSGPKSRAMSPADRELWLASKGGLPGMVLVTQDELNGIMIGVSNGNALLRNRESAIAQVVAAIGEYWTNEPDLGNAVGAAIFDATRFKSAVEAALESLPEIKAKLDSVIAASGEPFSVNADLLDVSYRLETAIGLLNAKRELRRQRKKSA